MKTLINSLAVIVTIFTLLALVGFDQKQVAISDNGIDGKNVFFNNCAVCHGADRSGQYPIIPSLINVNKKLGERKVLDILKTGRNGMPSFAHLPESERKAVTSYLMTDETQSNLIAEFSSDYRPNGQHLFYANCATCHKVTLADKQPKGQLGYGMKPAVLGGVISRYSFINFSMMLDKGPCYMPSFVGMQTDQKEAIFKYLNENSFQSNQNQRMNRGMSGRSCRSMMN